MTAPWQILSDTPLGQFRFLRLHNRRLQRMRDGHQDDFLWLGLPDWVMVLALTPQQRLILVRQFRFGVEDFSWEPPGGIIDAGESALQGAVRELREETGYAGATPEDLGWLNPNPALQGNRAFFVFIRDCVRVCEPQFDLNEDIEMREFPLEEAFAMALDGRIRHVACAAALFKLAAHLKLQPFS